MLSPDRQAGARGRAASFALAMRLAPLSPLAATSVLARRTLCSSVVPSLQGKVALVTGSGSGIGRASALALAKAGMCVGTTGLGLSCPGPAGGLGLRRATPRQGDARRRRSAWIDFCAAFDARRRVVRWCSQAGERRRCRRRPA